jgi:hypothetical protein
MRGCPRPRCSFLDSHRGARESSSSLPARWVWRRRPPDLSSARLNNRSTKSLSRARVAAGVFAPRAGETEASTRQQAFVDRLKSSRSATSADTDYLLKRRLLHTDIASRPSH